MRSTLRILLLLAAALAVSVAATCAKSGAVAPCCRLPSFSAPPSGSGLA